MVLITRFAIQKLIRQSKLPLTFRQVLKSFHQHIQTPVGCGIAIGLDRRQMMQRILATVLFVLIALRAAVAQEDVVWVQIEAQPTLAEAEARARAYAADLPDVNGFSLGGGWYAIALGPYARNDAEQVLQVYRAEGSIPRDSFIAFTRNFGQQFWPVGANAMNQPATTAPQTDTATAAAEPEPTPLPEVQPADETPREARASEADLRLPKLDSVRRFKICPVAV